MKWNRKSLFFSVLLSALVLSTIPTDAMAAATFKDVNEQHWASESVEWASNQGLTKGYPDGTFAPDKPITEAQFVTMLVRFDCSSPDSFPSSAGEHKAAGNYRYLTRNNIPLDGQSSNFSKDWPLKRGTAARIIAAYQGVDLSEAQAVYYMYMNDLATGASVSNTFKDFRPNDSLTRAEAVDLLHRISNTGACDLVGLSKRPTGSDNGKYPLPKGFKDDGTAYFPSPETNTKPPVGSTPPSYTANVDVEKKELIANGIDQTFITVSFCTGKSDSYEESLPFRVTSRHKAQITGDTGNQNKYTSVFFSDGPEVTVAVTAPKSTKALTDTITFQYDGPSGSSSVCMKKSVDVQLTYQPQAEVRIDVETVDHLQRNEKTSYITASIVRPGGERATNFNGRIRFTSSGSSYTWNEYVTVVNGRATAVLTRPWYGFELTDDLTVEVVDWNTWQSSDLQSILNQTHHHEIFYPGDMRLNPACTSEKPEIAFIIDSSGSMRRSDPTDARKKETDKLITALNAPVNIAAKFNSRGIHLATGAPDTVKSSLYRIDASGGTNIASGMKEAFSKFSGTGPKVAILLTDGKSGESQINAMITEAKTKGIAVFTIGLGNPQQLNETLLRKIALETGGTYYHVADSKEIASTYQSILDEITCGIKGQTCSATSQVFSSPLLEFRGNDFFMSTDVRSNCDIAKVIVRFQSNQGDIDYELVDRGQNHYKLTRGLQELVDLRLFDEGLFIAYDRNNKQIGDPKRVIIKGK
ncbi:S-layer homology domain-containing protein [Sporosarcina sp. Te-1]|uniref:S-layer homology domain-containing protein n=1 Tax=Sporosarcina sp. Te-1 TaxID=2818390 RepID=UPI001A9E35F4|nr:S-layer homology domain-containing protein [Sporosarcina sp. Te-1]QTD41070.1 S-layer homology domain-containing protein [Sporosarcina sp. Te-1]